MVEIRNFCARYFWIFFSSMCVKKNEREQRTEIRNFYVAQVDKYFWIFFITRPIYIYKIIGRER